MQAALTEQAKQASADGDLLPDVDPEASLGELLISAYPGAELMSIGTSAGGDLITRMKRSWGILLPSITDPGALPYFQEFLEREELRTTRPHHS